LLDKAAMELMQAWAEPKIKTGFLIESKAFEVFQSCLDIHHIITMPDYKTKQQQSPILYYASFKGAEEKYVFVRGLMSTEYGMDGSWKVMTTRVSI
jgi:hypothetical protein